MIPGLTTNSTCLQGEGTGAISFNIYGGCAPYGYSVQLLWAEEVWTTGTATQEGSVSLSNMVPGVYEIIVTDFAAQTASVVVDGIASNNMNIVVGNVESDDCSGIADLDIYTTVSGQPAAGYQVALWPEQPQATVTNVNAEGYAHIEGLSGDFPTYIIVYNLEGCGTWYKWNPTGSPLIVISTIHDAPCNEPFSGAVGIDVSGGTGNYAYNWTGPGNQTFTTQNITNLCAGTYTLTITSGNCTYIDDFVVAGPAYTDYGDVHITTNTTWNTPHEVCGNVIVEAGAIFRINDTEVTFAMDHGFIVEQGGYLKAANSTFDSNCPDIRWKGFQAIDDPLLPYATIADPLFPNNALLDLELVNCIVQNATVGVLCGNSDAQNFPQNSAGGASLQVQYCTFLNNWRDIYMADCNQANLDVSIFNNDFEINNDSYTQPNRVRVQINRIGKLIFSYNNMESKYSATLNNFLQSTAVIGSFWGYFYGNTISGFGNGLIATMSTISSPDAHFDFRGCVFRCYHGANLMNYGMVPILFFQPSTPYNAFFDLQSYSGFYYHINQALVNFNTTSNAFGANCYGLRLQRCYNYSIENTMCNMNENNEPSPALPNRLGFVIDDCRANQAGYINNVWIGRCTVGLMYRNRNRNNSQFGIIGANPRCIQFVENHEDMIVMRDPGITMNGFVGISPLIGTNDLSNGLDMSLSPNPTGSGNTDVRVTNEIFNFGNTHTFN
ncbi:MAG: hypothetical protein ACKVOR_02925, partial [Flavobacteriales bacterium]